jgi:hypothetical protein
MGYSMKIDTWEELTERQGNGYFIVYNEKDEPIAKSRTRQQCHDNFALAMDCVECADGLDEPHSYEEPMFTDLTDCVDGCNLAITHDGPCG